LAGGAAAVVAALVVLRPEGASAFAEAHGSFLAGALVLAATAWGLATGMVVALRR